MAKHFEGITWSEVDGNLDSRVVTVQKKKEEFENIETKS